MNKVDARFLKSRTAIVEAGIRVLLNNPAAGMSEIASTAGVGRATLYRHFETRDDLVTALALVCLQETDEVLQPVKDEGLGGLEAILASIDLIVPMANRFRFLMRLGTIAADNKTVTDIYRRQLKELSALVDDAKAAGDMRKELSTTWIVASYDALLNTAWALIDAGKMGAQDAAEHFRAGFLRGVGNS